MSLPLNVRKFLGIVWQPPLGNQCQVIKFRHPRRQMWSPRLNPSLKTPLLTFITEAVFQRCSAKKLFLKIFRSSHDEACNFIKKRLWHWCFPVNFYEVLNNTFFYLTPPLTASVINFRQAFVTQLLHFLNKI